jgi:hypothetical protein
MFHNIFEQIILNYVQAYYMLDSMKRLGLNLYMKEKPVHRTSSNDESFLAAGLYDSNNKLFNIVRVPLSRLNITQLVSYEYNEYVYMSESLFLIY